MLYATNSHYITLWKNIQGYVKPKQTFLACHIAEQAGVGQAWVEWAVSSKGEW